MKTVKELAWLAGILEGEGAFMMHGGTSSISLQSTDKDIVEKAAAILGTKLQGDSWKPKGKASYKAVWTCRVYGTTAIGWMMTLFILMGERRRAKIREIIFKWRASSAFPRAPRGQRFMALCHPDRVSESHGLCGTCNMKQWRRKTGRNTEYYRKKVKVLTLQ